MECSKCGDCCRELYLIERLKLALHTKTLAFKKSCKFLDKNNLCKIYPNRPKFCKDWKCDKFKIKS
jgi:Fe-S-cluster containining protein